MAHVTYAICVVCVLCCGVSVSGVWCLCGAVVSVRVVVVVHVCDVVVRCVGDVVFVFMCVFCCGARWARALAPQTLGAHHRRHPLVPIAIHCQSLAQGPSR